MAKQIINNGESGLTVREKINGNFSEVYDRNDFTDDEKTKLEGIEENAEVNQDNAEIKSQYEANADTNAFTDAEKSNLAKQSGTNTGDNATNTQYSGLVSNVTTNLSEGVSTETTVDVDSSDGTNATLISASTSRAGLLTKAKFDEIVANTEKVSFDSTSSSRLADTSGINTGDQQTLGLSIDKTYFQYVLQCYGGYWYAIDCIVTNKPGKMDIDSGDDTWQATSDIMGVSEDTLTFGDTGKTTILEFRHKVEVADSNDQSWGLTENNLYSAYNNTDKAVCFAIDGSTLYAKTSDGTTATTINISSGITITDWNVYKIEWAPGTDAKFYVNGILKATHTTNLPTTGTVRFGFGGTTNGQSQRCSAVVCVQEV